jgi:hypothetical protein
VRDPHALRKSIAQLAGRQWGHVTRAQLRALDIPSGTIDAWVRRGVLILVHAGVYAVGYRREDPIARACAAVLACGPGAVLSHDSALALWGLRRWPRVHEVITPGCVRRPGIRAHRSRTLRRAEITRHYGIPVTRAARAIADMRRAHRLTDRQVTRLTNQARLDHVLTADEAEALLRHRRNPTRSAAEDDLQRWFERHDIPQPVISVRRGGREIDAHFVDQGVILELDDYATHGDAATFQSDRDRDFDHLVDGDLVTVRLTPPRLTAQTAIRFKALLARRTASSWSIQ